MKKIIFITIKDFKVEKLKKLREKHSDVVDNQELRKVAKWRQTNTDNCTNEKKFVEKSKASLGILLSKLEINVDKK